MQPFKLKSQVHNIIHAYLVILVESDGLNDDVIFMYDA